MKQKLLIGIAVLAVLGGGAFVYLTRPVAEPTADIQTVANQLGSAPAEAPAVSPQAVLFRIVQDKSSAEFRVNEILNGNPFTAVGKTDQVAGDIWVAIAGPGETRLGTIRVNARTLKTDSTRRDGAVGRFILKSEDPANELIVFEPKTLSGLPEQIKQGVALTFTITGDLTVAGVTKPATFTANGTLDSLDTLTADAETVVRRADYGLVIPNVSFVAGVEDNVILKVRIVANRVDSMEPDVK